MIYLIDVYWTPRFNVFVLQCSCEASWQHWAKYSLVMCPRCGEKAWLHENEAVWDKKIGLVINTLLHDT